MPSATVPSTPPWSFELIYDVLKTWKEPQPASTTSNEVILLAQNERLLKDPAKFDPRSEAPRGLGDFGRLYDYLDWTDDERVFTPSTGTSESDTSSVPREPPPPVDLIETQTKGKEVRWKDEVPSNNFSPLATNLQSRIWLAKHTVAAYNAKKEIKNSADFESEVEEYLRPALIKKPKVWSPPPIPNVYIDPQIIQPLLTLTFAEKQARIVEKLKQRSNSYNGEPTQVKANTDGQGIHVFVDCSNIVIGFVEALKTARGLNVKAYTKQPPLSWQALSIILERGRSVARRIIVGSKGTYLDGQPSKLPSYLLEAEKCGYELNILQRVTKEKAITPIKKKNGKGNGYGTTSGHSSSDGGHMAQKAVMEQGVDEILQMKLLESLVDTQQPSVIVLASGDAAEAEYSGGFLKNVERALSKGWKVELISWGAGLSWEYRSKAFLKKWKDSFTVIELDDFSEDLLAVYAEKMLLF